MNAKTECVVNLDSSVPHNNDYLIKIFTGTDFQDESATELIDLRIINSDGMTSYRDLHSLNYLDITGGQAHYRIYRKESVDEYSYIGASIIE